MMLKGENVPNSKEYNNKRICDTIERIFGKKIYDWMKNEEEIKCKKMNM